MNEESQLIKIQYPVLDHTESIANCSIVEEKITKRFVTIEDAFSNNNSSLFIFINSSKEQIITVKSGCAYPNSMLGDLDIKIAKGINSFRIQDLQRFEKADGTLDLEFKPDFEGSIFAIAKWLGRK